MQNHHLESVSTCIQKTAREIFFGAGPISDNISNCMHGNNHPQGKRTVILMISLCVVLHFVVIPIWMYSLGLH